MSKQIFKNPMPKEILFNLLDALCIKTDKYYLLNNNGFKKGMFSEAIQHFFDECKAFYHNSKKKYLERKLTYNAFTTVVRQICNFNNIPYTSQIKYDKSSYDIVFYIYFK
jgi:hypothetical protein